ncbi:hypothetical protein A6R68_14181 [Neotoma lepida]|uniref:Uncharacterized protein n=1 Tax=Neotoma lepida TaxID=56216 RepID=A0A1A6HAG7_NEOLE|nr:hypothetical protein A6R68_14181 [Neotoma lepida]
MSSSSLLSLKLLQLKAGRRPLPPVPLISLWSLSIMAVPLLPISNPSQKVQ